MRRRETSVSISKAVSFPQKAAHREMAWTSPKDCAKTESAASWTRFFMALALPLMAAPTVAALVPKACAWPAPVIS